MRTGTIAGNDLVIFNPTVEPARYNAERYGAFVQTSYHWGDTATSSVSHMPIKAPPRLALQPTDWTGLYVGGHLGGGVSEAQWSDPFPTGPSGRGGTNVAGFGDSAHATGALGGGDIGANVQAGQVVLGAQLDGSLADLRGENTCFTGASAASIASTSSTRSAQRPAASAMPGSARSPTSRLAARGSIRPTI